VESRLSLIPPLAQGKDLMDFLAMADIQLDTYPYGGWTTNMEAVYAGLTIVTQEGEQARSRWGAHILRALGITAGIAHNEAEFVAQAVELVNNRELREETRRQVQLKAREVLFNGEAAQPAYETELLRIHAQAVAKKIQAVKK
jgi:predicted O-linked N-acetylglucosamine transferase (SPINDLY family)